MRYITLMALSWIVAVIGYAIRIPLAIIQLTAHGILMLISAICEKGIDIADEINYVSDDLSYRAENKRASHEVNT